MPIPLPDQSGEPWISRAIKAAAERVEAQREGPQGVWFEYADGVRYEDIPTIFVEVDADGHAMFECLPPRDPDVDRPVAIGAKVWPGKTGMRLPLMEGMPE